VETLRAFSNLSELEIQKSRWLMNLTTARSLCRTVPETLRAKADEVIE
jgi:hypothetical protein